MEAVQRERQGVLEAFIQRCPTASILSADILASAKSYNTIEVLYRCFGRELLDAIAPTALLIATDITSSHMAFEPLLEFFPSSVFTDIEDVVLNVLDWGYSPLEHMAQLINKLGDRIIVTERIIAAAAGDAYHGIHLLKMIDRWKPESFGVTQSLVEMVAATGGFRALEYLAKHSAGKFTIAGKWYRLAQFRQMVRIGSRFHPHGHLESEPFIIDTPDVYGRAALHSAAREGIRTSLVMKYLLGITTASVNAQDYRGWTALHFAVEGYDMETVQRLLDAGADPTIGNHRGETSISLAEERGSSFEGTIKLVDVLKGNGRLCETYMTKSGTSSSWSPSTDNQWSEAEPSEQEDDKHSKKSERDGRKRQDEQKKEAMRESLQRKHADTEDADERDVDEGDADDEDADGDDVDDEGFDDEDV